MVCVLAALAIAAVCVAATMLLWGPRKRELVHAHRGTESLPRMFVEETAQSFAGSRLILDGIRERLQTGFRSSVALDGPEVHLLLGAHALGSPDVRALFVVDPDGNVVNRPATTRSRVPPWPGATGSSHWRATVGLGQAGWQHDTREKFEARRMTMATHEWERMKQSNSRECRNWTR